MHFQSIEDESPPKKLKLDDDDANDGDADVEDTVASKTDADVAPNGTNADEHMANVDDAASVAANSEPEKDHADAVVPDLGESEELTEGNPDLETGDDDADADADAVSLQESTIGGIDGTNDGADEPSQDDDEDEAPLDAHAPVVNAPAEKAADHPAVNGVTIDDVGVVADVSMEAVLKTMNKHLKRAVNRLKGDDAKVAALKTHVGLMIKDVMGFSADGDRLEQAVESAIRRFESTGSFVPSAGGGSPVKPSLTTMQLDSELSLDELVNYLTDEIDNEHRKTRVIVAQEAAKEVTFPVPELPVVPVCPEVKGAVTVAAAADDGDLVEAAVSEDDKPVLMDKSKLFSEMEGKFAKDTDGVLKNKSANIRRSNNKSDPEAADAKIILVKEPGEVELKENSEIVVVGAAPLADDDDIREEPVLEKAAETMLMSPGARSDGAVDKEIESESESVSPVSASQSSDLIKSLRKVRVRRSRNSSSNNPESEINLSPMEVDDPSPPRLIRPRLLMSPPSSMPELTSQIQKSPPVLFPSLQIEIPDPFRRGPVSGTARLTPRMSPAAAAARRIEVSPTVLSKVDAETAAAAVLFTPLASPRNVNVVTSAAALAPLNVAPMMTSPSPSSKQNGDQASAAPPQSVPVQVQSLQQQHQQQQQQQQPQPPQQQPPLASLKTVIRVPKTLTSTPLTSSATTTTISSSTLSLSSLPVSQAVNSGHENSMPGKKPKRRKPLANLVESDGGIDTAEEEEYGEHFFNRRRIRKLASDNEYDGKSADESNTEGGGKQSPDSGGAGRSALDEKLTE